MDTLACFVHRILFLGAVVCITASANLMLEYNWPAPDPNINRFPHEASCHHYYLMLSEEDISVEKCPDGQLFDYVKHNCISDREHIHCWSRHFGKMKHGHLHMKHKKHFKCPYPWGKYPHLHDCTKYHLCLSGKPRVKKCAPFELFDKITRKCIASIDAVCADKTDVVEHGYVCPKTWGSFTYSKDCSKYYECLQRKPSLRTCLKGYLFDNRLAKCAPKEHVYCGVRHNPYEKISSVVPETSSVPNTSQKSTSLRFDVTTITEAEEVISLKPVSQKIKSTPQETSSTVQKVTSLPLETSSTVQKVTSLPLKSSSTFQKVTPLPEETSSSFQKVTSFQEETSPALHEVTSTQASENKPISSEISSTSAAQVNNNEIKQESSIASADPNVKKLEGQPETSDVSDDVSEKNEFVEVTSTTEKEQIMSSQIAFKDESDDQKKDVSTEEKDANDISIISVTVGTQGSKS
ncbi:unnamed protein product [Larinioides sclopetarius]|uniref:Chitin-binding type-2 domain-containing protein n=1 Tax=Larinioides sclopetarius TaxID=280406 RepID=A0AAV1ZVC7_9ARAC